MTVDLHDFHAAGEAVLEPAAQLEQALTVVLHLGHAEFTRLAEADDAGHVLRAAAHAALLTAAVDERLKPHAGLAAAHVERADALGAVHLVAAPAEQVDAVTLDVGGHLADPLRAVGVEDHALLVAEPADLGHLVDGADLVVRPHDAHEDRVGPHGRAHHLGGDHAVGRRIQEGHVEALALQALAGIEHGLVLDRASDDVAAALLPGGSLGIDLGGALHGEVVALGGAAGEDDFLRVGADQAGGLLAGGLDAVLGIPAETVVAASGIAELLAEIGKHGLHDAGVAAGGGGIVEVDGGLHGHGLGILQLSLREMDKCTRHGGPRRGRAAVPSPRLRREFLSRASVMG